MILQEVKLNSRLIAIIGLIMSILSCGLIADWQSIPFDQCTNFSLYHHPTLHINNTIMESNIITSIIDENMECSIINDSLDVCKKTSDECHIIQNSNGLFLEIFNYPCEVIANSQNVKKYLCQWNWNTSLCVYINETDEYKFNKASDTTSQYFMNKCTQSKFRGDHCHWIPNSQLTEHYCSDCQPICRSPSGSLNFVQFCLGAALLMLSIPIAWVPVASMASERTKSEMQVITYKIILIESI